VCVVAKHVGGGQQLGLDREPETQAGSTLS
jgi:hypothetical protein